jgi:hypothetical protein
MADQRLVLTGLCDRTKGLQWESERTIKIGRDNTQDVVLDDGSVARRHAELVRADDCWVLRSLADADRYPTLLNGQVVGARFGRIKHNDLIHCGVFSLRVALTDTVAEPAPSPCLPPAGDYHIQGSDFTMRVEARTQNTWDETFEIIARQPRPEPRRAQSLLTLLRSSKHLQHLASPAALLEAVLDDSIQTLRAQRGSIVLADPKTGVLRVRALQAPSLPSMPHRGFSKTLAERAFSSGESLLCRDVRTDDTLMSAASVLQGAMASVICALLRSPRQCLGVLHLDRGPFQEIFDEADLYLADGMAAGIAVAIETAQQVEQQRDQFLHMAKSLAATVEQRDQYGEGRSRRVTDYALLLAEEISLPREAHRHLELGAPLHDIGKISLDDAILRKPGKLTPDEFTLMKLHPVTGVSLLQGVLDLQPVLPIVRHHHERWDGTGYPDGLSAEQISPVARVVAVADAFDAMTSHRPYRPAMSLNGAMAELLRRSGSHFDPQCVHAFMRLRYRVEQILKK